MSKSSGNLSLAVRHDVASMLGIAKIYLTNRTLNTSVPTACLEGPGLSPTGRPLF